MKNINGYYARLYDILSVENDDIRDQRLNQMMDDMMLNYDIPLQNKPEFNQAHAEIMKLYRLTGRCRNRSVYELDKLMLHQAFDGIHEFIGGR